ncbi:DUF2059 domain-containing protein [Comamonas serinivorans]|nr:DUF2059 domain-containing protein [Comamonas serinivorans]
MKTWIVSLALACCAGIAQAAPPSSASIEQLLALTGAERLLNDLGGITDQVLRTSMQDASQGQALTAEQQAVMDRMPAKLAALLREEMAWDKVKPHYVRIYQESFDQAEIDGLIAFYASPAGQAMVQKMPTVMAKSMAFMQVQMRSIMPKLNALVQDTLDEARQAKPPAD